jgi:hypothetical protein
MKKPITITEEEVDRLVKKINYCSGQNLFKRSRKEEVIMARVLFCKILRFDYNLSQRVISDIFRKRGVKYSLSSVRHSALKFGEYLQHNPTMQVICEEFYGKVFDRKEEVLNLVVNSLSLSTDEFLKAVKANLHNVKLPKPKPQKKLKSYLPDGLTMEQEKEVMEMVKLKVKSYEWKCANKTKVYVGSGYVDTTV